MRALDAPGALAADPVRFARGFGDPRDREAAAFLASALAFGNVKAIGASVAALLAALGPRPAAAAGEVARGRRRLPPGLYHRWLKGPEIHALVAALGRTLEGWGSLEACFRAGFSEGDGDIGPALTAFAARLFPLPHPLSSGPGREGAPGRRAPLFPSPAGGSACKRPCLFLRWVARRDDGIDLGLWRSVPAAKLVVPVDVHVARVARRLGALRRRSADWKAALEITAALRRVDPDDPLRFDFAMVHVDRAEAAARAAGRG